MVRLALLWKDARHKPGSMEFVPDFQQHAVSILAPLVIPEPQLFDSFSREKRCAFLVALKVIRQAVLEPVQLDARRAIGQKKSSQYFPFGCWRRNVEPAKR